MENGLTDKENIAFATGFYTCVARLSILLEMYKSNQVRKYLEMMIKEATDNFTDEDWSTLKRNAIIDIKLPEEK